MNSANGAKPSAIASAIAFHREVVMDADELIKRQERNRELAEELRQAAEDLTAIAEQLESDQLSRLGINPLVSRLRSLTTKLSMFLLNQS
jgi:hypothetical protein